VSTITIYSRPGCHLCDDMKATVDLTIAPFRDRIRVEHVDISGDADLEARYGLEIPVLLVDGRKVAKYRVTADALTRLLRADG